MFKWTREIQKRMLSKRKLLAMLGIVVLYVAVWLIAMLLVVLIAASVVASSQTRDAFFSAAMGVSSALFIAVFLVAAKALDKVRDEKERRTQFLWAAGNILVVFIGLLAAAFGLLSPLSSGITNVVFAVSVTWLFALLLMLQGLAAGSGRPSED